MNYFATLFDDVSQFVVGFVRLDSPFTYYIFGLLLFAFVWKCTVRFCSF